MPLKESICFLMTFSFLHFSCGAFNYKGILEILDKESHDKISSTDFNANDVIAPPEIELTVYVDGLNGSDDNDGASEQTAFRSLKYTIQNTGNKTKIYVMNGEYNNDDFGNGVNNGAIMTLKVEK